MSLTFQDDDDEEEKEEEDVEKKEPNHQRNKSKIYARNV